MFKKGFITRMKESLGIWPAYSGKNIDIDAGEPVLGIKKINYQRLETRLKQISEKYKAIGLTVAVVRNGEVRVDNKLWLC